MDETVGARAAKVNWLTRWSDPRRRQMDKPGRQCFTVLSRSRLNSASRGCGTKNGPIAK
jgi:hypothetical protein